MGRLEFKDGIYHINKKVPFIGSIIKKESINIAFEFAFNMVYGGGFHREHRSGGNIQRNPIEVLANTFQGKLAELVLNDKLLSYEILTSGVDLKVLGKGLWDHGDIIANGKTINVKSMAFFSNLFLLESKDWDKEGNYIPDIEKITYDYFVGVRIKPNIKELFSKDSTKQIMLDLLNDQVFYFDIPGVLSLITLKEIINRDYLIKKGDKLNHTTMDADNYYIQCGDLFPFTKLIKELTI
ncbi:hypothetical protein HZP65_01265 [Elizabethkingia anophelis]|nr:hypothetical protein [Elizabethkingia anophelis]MCT4275594.1 hypothetical protein [Elizabethkingia anophelis]MCT4278380.1 hypothetical protein [Elizabethkingia anophelis]